jgi:hypothetical protein
MPTGKPRELWTVVVLAVAACTATPSAPPSEAPPAPTIFMADAGPVAVIETFLKTLVIQECATARGLSTESGFRQVGGFCERIRVVNFRIVGDAARPSADEAVFATTLTIGGGDASLPAGDHTIFFSVERQPGNVWRVTGGGTGP